MGQIPQAKLVKVAEIPRCDICEAQPAKYNTPTRLGPWGSLCGGCFLNFGIPTSVTEEYILDRDT